MARNGLGRFHIDMVLEASEASREPCFLYNSGGWCALRHQRRAVGFSQRPSRRLQLSAGRRAPSPVGELTAAELPRLPASVRSPCSTAPSPRLTQFGVWVSVYGLGFGVSL